MASTIPTYDQSFEIIDVEADAELVQKSLAKKPSFFGDVSTSSHNQTFNIGVSTAALYSGIVAFKDQIVSERNQQTGYRLTTEEFKLLQKRANGISKYGKIPYDVAEDFLVILCFVDNISDMEKIADAVQIAELNNPQMINNPMLILNISKLENVCFAASAVDGLVNLYRKYLSTSQNVANSDNQNGDSIDSVLNTISNLVGGFGGGGNISMRVENAEIGNFLSELITGKRIPTNVIAKNPMLQNPSYVGKAFFGELANSMSNVDIDQLFNKKIAVFPKPSSGTGTSSFSMQNFGSFSRSMSLEKFVAKVITGSSEINSQRKQNQIDSAVQQINTMTGSKSTDMVDITRADNAIPIMMALSANLSGFDKSVFSATTFKQGWVFSQSVASYLQQQNSGFLQAARKLL